jgi:hypothetical protein
MMCSTLPAPLVRGTLSATERHSTSEHAINNDQHLMCDRHNGTLWSEALYKQSEPRLEQGSLLATGGPRTLYQRGSQILVAVRRLAAFPDACALTVPRAQTCPTGHLLGGGTSQICSCFSQDRSCGKFTDPAASALTRMHSETVASPFGAISASKCSNSSSRQAK